MISTLRTLRRFSRDVRLQLIVLTLLGFTVSGGITAVVLDLYLLRLGCGPGNVGLVNSGGGHCFWPSSRSPLPSSAPGCRIIVGPMLLAAGQCLLPLTVIIPAVARLGWLLATNGLANLGLRVLLVNGSPFLMGATGPAAFDVWRYHAGLWAEADDDELGRRPISLRVRVA